MSTYDTHAMHGAIKETILATLCGPGMLVGNRKRRQLGAVVGSSRATAGATRASYGASTPAYRVAEPYAAQEAPADLRTTKQPRSCMWCSLV